MDLLTQVASIVEKIGPGVEALAARLAGPRETAAARIAPGDLEQQCRDLGLAVAHELFAHLVQAYGDGKQGTTVRCPCGAWRRWVGTRPRTLRDLMNRELTVHRAYYFCDTCGQGWLPLDEQLGLTGAQVTPALYEVAVLCGSMAPPEEAAELLARVAGIAVSAKSLERYTKAAGAATDQALDGRAQTQLTETTVAPSPGPSTPPRPYNLQLDGGMLRMRRGGFREVKVACLFDARERAEVHEGRHVLLHPHYEAHLGGPARVGQLAYAAARAAGVTADGSNAISQGDGAPWVWNLVQEHWPAALEVLDFYHSANTSTPVRRPSGASGAGGREPGPARSGPRFSAAMRASCARRSGDCARRRRPEPRRSRPCGVTSRRTSTACATGSCAPKATRSPAPRWRAPTTAWSSGD